MFKFGKKSKQNMQGLHPELIRVLERGIQNSRIDFGIGASGGLRTEQQQKDLYEKGLSKCDGVFKKSYHQSGRAVDVFAYVDGKASYEPYHLAMIATAMMKSAMELGCTDLEWGGLWTNFVDMPHFQLNERDY